MCRLLGFVANKPVDLEFSLERFKGFSDINPDGWGIGWYENGAAKVYKQGISAKDRQSELPRLAKAVISKMIISHVRSGTGAPPLEVNSHPFEFKNWLFAHNGSVDRDYLLSLLKDEYKQGLRGETDSEVYFFWILQNIETTGDIIGGIKKAIDKIMGKTYTGLNFLLANGEMLYAFRYASGSRSYYSLYKLEREPTSPGPLDLLSQETKELIHSKSLSNEKAILVCSEKLTKENWSEIGFGNLLEIDADLKVKELTVL
jgi:glutamine amidotransferase